MHIIIIIIIIFIISIAVYAVLLLFRGIYALQRFICGIGGMEMEVVPCCVQFCCVEVYLHQVFSRKNCNEIVLCDVRVSCKTLLLLFVCRSLVELS